MKLLEDRFLHGIADNALSAMFAARKRVFIDLLGWDLTSKEGRYEIDQFDTADAAYLTLNSHGPRHRGSARLLRTDKAHILGDIFPSLCAGPVPRGPSLREITRFCIEPNLPRDEQRRARDELVSALVHYARASNLAGYTAVAGVAWFRRISRFGWDCHALGEPQIINGEKLVALQISIREDTVSAISQSGIFCRPDFQVLRLDEQMAL